MKGRRVKPRRVFNSVFLLIVAVSSMLLMAQAYLFDQISLRSMNRLRNSLIESKQIETRSYAELISSDLEEYQTSTYEFFNSTSYKRCLLAIESKRYTSQYLEDVRRVWYDLQIRQFALDYIETIDIYMLNLMKRMTASSVLDMTAEDAALLDRVVTGGAGITMLDDRLYLWVGQRFGQASQPEKMRAVAIAGVSEASLRTYLCQYHPETMDSSFQLYYHAEDGTTRLLCSLDPSIPVLSELPAQASGFEERQLADGGHDLATWAPIGSSPMSLVMVTPWQAVAGELEQYEREMGSYRMLLLIVVLIVMSFIYLTINRPVRRLRTALRAIRKGDLSVRLGKTWSSEFQDVYDQFNRMADQLQKQIEIEYSMKLLTAKAELRQLQYQINPHFLYNAYFNLQALLEEEETEKAAVFSGMLGKYLGYITHSDQNARLSEELEHAKVCAEIQQLRFSDRVQLQFTAVPPWAGELTVPRLIVQPLIENAYEHGVKMRLRDGIIRVSFATEGGAIQVIVEDNGQSLTDEALAQLSARLAAPEGMEAADSVALWNIQQRLRLFYGNGSCLRLSRSALGGLQAAIWLMEVEPNVAHSDR